MNKKYLKFFLPAVIGCGFLFADCNSKTTIKADVEEENDAYDGPRERAEMEFRKTQDLALGRVPVERLWNAVLYTENLKNSFQARGASLIWQSRGPAFDSVGSFNGNGRGGTTGVYTSGRVRAVLVDASDATGNKVFAGGVSGGLWKCTNFLSTVPNWQPVNDFFTNLAITSLAQHPANPSVMYFTTGEPNSSPGIVLGLGVWKSTDGGNTWAHLPSTINYTQIFKVLVDGSGNIYLATRGFGLVRSIDGGTTWTNINPTGLSTFVSDMEFSDGGRLHASFGYSTGSGTINVRYANNPATVDNSRWSVPTGLPTTSTNRIELAASGTTLYAAPTNTSNNVVSTYKSIDNGATWTKNNVVNYTNSISNTQGWWNISLEINPADASQFIVGGLDAYRSLDSGVTVAKMTSWVNGSPYVHADHHYARWVHIGAESRILLASDGGLFLSRDNGATFTDKNQNLIIKQFYSCAIHPTLTDRFIGGTQDNGTHLFKYPGLASSVEVIGGDGGYTAIDQNEPQFQFGSTTNSNYRRSADGGNSFTSFNFGTSGDFINPYEYDGLSNTFYANNGSTLRRWENPTTATSVADAQQTMLTLPNQFGDISALTISPYTPNRLFIGTTQGTVLRINNANTVTAATVAANTSTIQLPVFGGNINNIAFGSSENFMAVIFSNYGATNIWYSSDGGVNWTGIDGNLPDMPVRWALFDPHNNNKMIIATEAGVYTTSLVDGFSTNWFPSPGFPTVRTDMLKFRASDNLILAATHGRGMWTTNISPTSLPVKNVTLFGTLSGENRASLKWTSEGETSKTRYRLQFSTDGVTFEEIADLPNNIKTFTHSLSASIGYYRIMAVDINQMPVFSNVISLKNRNTKQGLQVKIQPNPVHTNASFVVSNNQQGDFSYTVFDLMGKALQAGKASVTNGGSTIVPLRVNNLPAGMYRIKVMFKTEMVTSSFIKQ